MKLLRFLPLIVFLCASASAQTLDPITNITFQNNLTADQGLFNNVTGSTVSATTMTAGSLGVGDITSSGDISANAITTTTGTFNEIVIGGGNIHEALFPLQENADFNSFDLLNGGKVQATTGEFDTVILGGGNLEEALFPLKNDADAGGNSLTNVLMLEADSLKFDGGTGTLNDVTIDSARIDAGSATLSAIEFSSGTGTLQTVTILDGTGTFDEVTSGDLTSSYAD